MTSLDIPGRRQTPARKQLMDLLQNSGTPVTAVQLIECLSAQGLAVNKTTVYRQLDFLEKQGLVSALSFLGQRYYESGAIPHHHHFICQACGLIVDVPAKPDLAEHSVRLFSSVKSSFVVLDHQVEFIGLCKECRK